MEQQIRQEMALNWPHET